MAVEQAEHRPRPRPAAARPCRRGSPCATRGPGRRGTPTATIAPASARQPRPHPLDGRLVAARARGQPRRAGAWRRARAGRRRRRRARRGRPRGRPRRGRRSPGRAGARRARWRRTVRAGGRRAGRCARSIATPRPAARGRRGRAPSTKRFDARIEVAQFAQPRAQARRRWFRVCHLVTGRPRPTRCRLATKPASSRSAPPRGPKIPSAAVAVSHSSRASDARPVHTAERHERRLARVGQPRLAGFRRVAFDVEQVVDDLEREAEVLGVGGQRGHLLRPRAGRQRAGHRRRDEQRAGLPAVDQLERLERDGRLGGQQVLDLTADQPFGARRRGDERGQLPGERRLVGAGDASRTPG